MTKMYSEAENFKDRTKSLNSRNKKRDRKKKARKPKKIWSQEEDDLLLKLINKYGPSKWSVIASFMVDRQGK